jgi:hypothetical protein
MRQVLVRRKASKADDAAFCFEAFATQQMHKNFKQMNTNKNS